MAYVPVAFVLAGMAAYTVLAGADFGAGLWSLLAVGPSGSRVRDACRHAMGPVWEANHVWLIFVLVVCWTAYPVAFGSIMSTLAAPLLIAAVGIIFRGAAYALRGVSSAGSRAEWLLGLSSVLTPFALGTAIGAIATGRVPVGNATGNLVTSWLSAAPALVGVLAVAFSGYLAAVFLAGDSVRYGSVSLAEAFRRRALLAGLVSGGLALAGLLVLRRSGLPGVTHGASLALVVVSGVAGVLTLILCWFSRFGLARLSAALAVAAVVAGWAAAQAPRFLPGMTVTQAAAGRSTLVALVIAVAGGALVLVPSLALLFTLFLRGRLDTPEVHGSSADEAPEAPLAVPAGELGKAVTGAPARARADGSPARADGSPAQTGGMRAGGAPAQTGGMRAGGAPARAGGMRADGMRAGTAVVAPLRQREWGLAAAAGLVAGTGLLIFTDAAWTHGLGVAGLVLCAVAVFALVTAAPGT